MSEQPNNQTMATQEAENSSSGTIQEVMGRMTELERAILERRARELARTPDTETEAGEMVEVLNFHLGTETYAVEIRCVHQVRPLERLTPVPCTPSFVAGVVNLQGEILSLLDFRRFLGLQQEGITDLMEIIVVEAAGLKIGLMANRVDEVNWFPLAYFEEPPVTVNEFGAEFIKGVTSEGLILLNLEAILGDARIVVSEEVQ